MQASVKKNMTLFGLDHTFEHCIVEGAPENGGTCLSVNPVLQNFRTAKGGDCEQIPPFLDRFCTVVAAITYARSSYKKSVASVNLYRFLL
jgi:hypothetical protein